MKEATEKNLERLDYLSKKNKNKVIVFLFKKLYEFSRKNCPENFLILDIGCGFGWGTKYLSLKGHVYGVDIDQETVFKTRKRYKSCQKIKFLAADALKLPFKDRKFDVIVSIENIEYVFDTNGYLKEMKRVIKKNGILVVSTPNKSHLGHRLKQLIGVDYWVNPFHPVEFSEKELSTLLEKNGFKVKKTRRFLLILPLFILNFVEKSNFFQKQSLISPCLD